VDGLTRTTYSLPHYTDTLRAPPRMNRLTDVTTPGVACNIVPSTPATVVACRWAFLLCWTPPAAQDGSLSSVALRAYAMHNLPSPKTPPMFAVPTVMRCVYSRTCRYGLRLLAPSFPLVLAFFSITTRRCRQLPALHLPYRTPFPISFVVGRLRWDGSSRNVSSVRNRDVAALLVLGCPPAGENIVPSAVPSWMPAIISCLFFILLSCRLWLRLLEDLTYCYLPTDVARVLCSPATACK